MRWVKSHIDGEHPEIHTSQQPQNVTNPDPKVEADDLHPHFIISQIASRYREASAFRAVQSEVTPGCIPIRKISLGLTGVREGDSNEMKRRGGEWQIPRNSGNLSINPEKERITTALGTWPGVCRDIYATIEAEPHGRVKWHISRLEQDDLRQGKF